jgi:Arc/MetJ family transcription regulator
MLKKEPMLKTIDVDDELFAEAQRITGLVAPGEVVHAALTALIEKEAYRRLAMLGGTVPNLEYIPRRRPSVEPIEASETMRAPDPDIKEQEKG